MLVFVDFYLRFVFSKTHYCRIDFSVFLEKTLLFGVRECSSSARPIEQRPGAHAAAFAL